MILGLLNQNVTDEPVFTEANSLVGRDHIQATQDLIAPTSLQSFRGHLNDLFRLFRTWSPEFIPFAMPDIGYCVIGPAAITLRLARSLGTTSKSKQKSSPTVEEDILNLVLKRLAKYWEVGDVILGTSLLHSLFVPTNLFRYRPNSGKEYMIYVLMMYYLALLLQSLERCFKISNLPDFFQTRVHHFP